MNAEWLSDNFIELFGTVTGILYVILEVKQNKWLWFVGILTSAVYVWVFFEGKIYADMSLQVYYLVISFVGWYWWSKGSGLRADVSSEALAKEEGTGQADEGKIQNSKFKIQNEKKKYLFEVTRINRKTAFILSFIFLALYCALYMILSQLTDSPVPQWDSFITALSVVATWMLARKIYEHWYLWIIVNTVSAILFVSRGLYPTVILYTIYCIMSFVGLFAWKKTIKLNNR